MYMLSTWPTTGEAKLDHPAEIVLVRLLFLPSSTLCFLGEGHCVIPQGLRNCLGVHFHRGFFPLPPARAWGIFLGSLLWGSVGIPANKTHKTFRGHLTEQPLGFSQCPASPHSTSSRSELSFKRPTSAPGKCSSAGSLWMHLLLQVSRWQFALQPYFCDGPRKVIDFNFVQVFLVISNRFQTLHVGVETRN